MLQLAGKRKGLLWKEVDDGTAEMLPRTSSVLNVIRLVFLDSSIGLLKIIIELQRRFLSTC